MQIDGNVYTRISVDSCLHVSLLVFYSWQRGENNRSRESLQPNFIYFAGFWNKGRWTECILSNCNTMDVLMTENTCFVKLIFSDHFYPAFVNFSTIARAVNSLNQWETEASCFGLSFWNLSVGTVYLQSLISLNKHNLKTRFINKDLDHQLTDQILKRNELKKVRTSWSLIGFSDHVAYLSA